MWKRHLRHCNVKCVGNILQKTENQRALARFVTYFFKSKT